MLRVSLAICLFVASLQLSSAQEPAEGKASDNFATSLFRKPRQAEQTRRAVASAQPLLSAEKFAEAEKLLAEAIARRPDLAVNYYYLACAQSRQDKPEAAIENLKKAVEHGFNDGEVYDRDPYLSLLKERDDFRELSKNLRRGFTPSNDSSPTEELVGQGKALVTESNTGWLNSAEHFQTFFKFAEDDPRRSLDAVVGHGRAGELIRQWQKEGTAAGLVGVLYDNHDRQHSPLSLDQFPQLTAIEYCEEAKKETLDHGHAGHFIFNCPTFGNSSTALTNGPFWRSQTRIAQTNAGLIAMHARQYANNHLYFYPEHRDYDPGRNGQNDGYGDVYPANTPYVITSQGSSGSDQAFLHAVACTLAAFRPETQQALIKHKLLMPTVQQIFRRSNKQVQQPEDYFTGKAHPVVFQGDQIDTEKMVTLAHELEPDALPPLAMLRVLADDEPELGVDYFDANAAEKLFDTPCAIARIHRTTARIRSMTLSGLPSKDVNDRPLTWHWKVLQGNVAAIEIIPQREDQSIVDVRIPWHERFPCSTESKLETNRVDLALFVHNGVHYSPPAFISIYFPDSERRTYDDAGRIQSVEYRPQATGGNYADPMAYIPREWKDEYQYSDGKLLGWKRTRGDKSEEFTRHGHLVLEKDDLGRPLRAARVRYASSESSRRMMPELQQQVTKQEVRYEYVTAEDRLGRLAERPVSQGLSCE